MSLKDRLKLVEGLSLHAYVDPISNKLHIGYGRNLDAVGISDDEAERMLDNDILRARATARLVVGSYALDALSPIAQDALFELAFILGHSGLRRFSKMIAAIRRGNMMLAKAELLDSKMHDQIPQRTKEIADALLR